jgi:hypothetical protein
LLKKLQNKLMDNKENNFANIQSSEQLKFVA